jgi:ribosome biogenesis GTPase / thiamine phosphate phosphatase
MDYTPARVSLQHKQRYHLICEQGELVGEVTGRLLHRSVSRADLPVVGDWVAVSVRPNEGTATIHAVLPRQSGFSRKAVLAGGPGYGEGKTEEQVLAANIDTVFLVSGLDNDFNVRRIERFAAVAWDSGAKPVVILNKADVCKEVEACIQKVEQSLFGVPVHPMTAVTNQGIEPVRTYLRSGQTAVFLGSSGVGKSTIINALLGEDRLDTGGVRLDDSKGRHTTTHREMILLPDGGIVIDTPGVRRLTLWGEEQGLERTFADVELLVAQCRFTDCTHNGEPGCAIAEALEGGALDQGRFQSYLKLQKELRHLQRRQDDVARRRDERAFDRMIAKRLKEMKELRKKGLA